MKIKKIPVNISIDDVSPHPLSSDKVLEQCFHLIEKFNDIKFSLFVPMSYWRTVFDQDEKVDTRTVKPLRLSENIEFVNKLKSLPNKNFEIGYHGYFHGQIEADNNNEFKDLNRAETLALFKKMSEEAKLAGISDLLKPIFRPPGWAISQDGIIAAREFGMEILTLSPDKNIRKMYKLEDQNNNDVVYYNVCPPWKPWMLFRKIEAVYHACEWSANYLGEYETIQIENFLERHFDNLRFEFTKEMKLSLNRVYQNPIELVDNVENIDNIMDSNLNE